MVKPTVQKLPKPPIKPSEVQPKKKERKKRPTITDIHEGQLYINGQWLTVDPPMKRPSRSEMRKEAWHDIWQGINESMLAFFNTCLGELVLLFLVCALISGFIVLILKLTGNL